MRRTREITDPQELADALRGIYYREMENDAGDIDEADDAEQVVWCGVMHDGSGYTPGGALYISDRSEDDALQGADELFDEAFADDQREAEDGHYEDLKKDNPGWDDDKIRETAYEYATEGTDGFVIESNLGTVYEMTQLDDTFKELGIESEVPFGIDYKKFWGKVESGVSRALDDVLDDMFNAREGGSYTMDWDEYNVDKGHIEVEIERMRGLGPEDMYLDIRYDMTDRWDDGMATVWVSMSQKSGGREKDIGNESFEYEIGDPKDFVKEFEKTIRKIMKKKARSF